MPVEEKEGVLSNIYNPVGWAQSKVAVLLERKMVNIADTFNEVGLQKLLMIIYFKIKPAGSELRKEEGVKCWKEDCLTAWDKIFHFRGEVKETGAM